MAINIGDSFIDSEDVVSRLEKLLNKRDELTFIVYRVRNDETIETFDNKDDADGFVDKEDYDPERVKVRMTSKGLDSDDEEELSDLETIDRDGSNIFGDWGSITVQLESDVDTEEYAREIRAAANGDAGRRCSAVGHQVAVINACAARRISRNGGARKPRAIHPHRFGWRAEGGLLSGGPLHHPAR